MEIKEYLTEKGLSPFGKWYKKIDNSLRVKVDARLTRIKLWKNFGNSRSLGNGVFELKFNQPSGPRIYCAKDGNSIVLLLIGGDKSTQSKDIKKAKEYFKEYKKRGKDHGK